MIPQTVSIFSDIPCAIRNCCVVPGISHARSDKHAAGRQYQGSSVRQVQRLHPVHLPTLPPLPPGRRIAAARLHQLSGSMARGWIGSGDDHLAGTRGISSANMPAISLSSEAPNIRMTGSAREIFIQRLAQLAGPNRGCAPSRPPPAGSRAGFRNAPARFTWRNPLAIASSSSATPWRRTICNAA